MMNPDMQKAHWKPCSSTMPAGPDAVFRRIREPSIVKTFWLAHRVRENRTRIMRHIVEQDRTGAAFGAVAPQLRSRQAQFVSQRPRQGFLLHDVDSAALPVDV